MSEWRVDLSRERELTFDAAKMLGEFSDEWAEAQAEGLDEEEFVRETVAELGWSLCDYDWVIWRHDDDDVLGRLRRRRSQNRGCRRFGFSGGGTGQ